MWEENFFSANRQSCLMELHLAHTIKNSWRLSLSKGASREFCSLREEMVRYRASCAYERYKRDCDEYEKEQRSLHRTSKSRSTSSKRDSSKKCLDNQDKEFENSRIESKPRESKDDFRSRTKALVDSMMEKISQVLDSHLEQLNHVSTGANKGKFHSSPSLIEEPHMNEL